VRVLIADDEEISRRILTATLTRWGHEVVACADGATAWAALEGNKGPRLAILDWMMPGLDGIEICRRVREAAFAAPPYLILLTARRAAGDVVKALDQGADDHIAKPFDPPELRARINVGSRILALQEALAEKVDKLEVALASVKRLQGLFPICCYCKRIRGDASYWREIESYITENSEAQFSHGICPDCFSTHVAKDLGEKELQALARRRDARAEPGGATP
jgi:CheY-like chemotaxis protein